MTINEDVGGVKATENICDSRMINEPCMKKNILKKKKIQQMNIEEYSR
jgi:hypothetical protein